MPAEPQEYGNNAVRNTTTEAEEIEYVLSGVSKIEGHQEGIPMLQKISLNSQARFSTAAVLIQEDFSSADTFHKRQRGKKATKERHFSLETSSSG